MCVYGELLIPLVHRRPPINSISHVDRRPSRSPHTHTPSRPSSSRTATQQHFCFTSQTDEAYSCSQAFVQIAATTQLEERGRPDVVRRSSGRQPPQNKNHMYEFLCRKIVTSSLHYQNQDQCLLFKLVPTNLKQTYCSGF